MRRRAVVLGCSAALAWGLTACSDAASQASSSSAAVSPTAGGAAAAAALTVKELPRGAAGFRQVGDGLLGGAANTDARAFSSADGAIVLEVDLAKESDAGAALSGFGSFQSAAAAQVPQSSSQTSPALGQRAQEYIGTDAGGRSSVSLTFVDGGWLAVVTMKSAAGLVDPALVEAIATAQDRKLAGR